MQPNQQERDQRDRNQRTSRESGIGSSGANDAPLAESSDAIGDTGFFLRAYRISGASELPIVPAASHRAWMDARNLRWAYRCLPMVIANQSGWFILNPRAFFVRWTGGDEPDSVKFVYPGGPSDAANSPAESHFGYGILSWKIPFLFRTPPGYNLLVRGPANSPKDAISPLEGVVETDWAAQTFTMNWKFTRPNVVVPFSTGEPFCMLVPQRRVELEAFRPEYRDLSTESKLAEQHRQFTRGRAEALAAHRWEDHLHGDRVHYWQKNYFRGLNPDGSPAAEHQTKRHLHGFEGKTNRGEAGKDR